MTKIEVGKKYKFVLYSRGSPFIFQKFNSKDIILAYRCKSLTKVIIINSHELFHKRIKFVQGTVYSVPRIPSSRLNAYLIVLEWGVGFMI